MGTTNQEWLNQNALRAYPLAEDCTRRPVQAPQAFAIPDELVVDFVLAMTGPATATAGIVKLTKTGPFVSLTWADGDGTIIGSATAAATAHTRNQAYALTMSGDYEDASGWVVIGDMARAMSAIPDGDWTFAQGAARMETSTVRPCIRGVQAVRVSNGGDVSAWLRGHITLVAGQNIVLTPDTLTRSIRVDARDSTGFNEECACTEETLPEPIRRVNGVNVEDLQIVGDGQCIDVRVEGNVMTLRDMCSKPCCGCPELDELNRILGVAEAALAKLEGYAGTLTSKQNEFAAKMGTTLR